MNEAVPWTPLGQALADYADGLDAEMVLFQEDGEYWALPAAVFFRSFDEMSELEEAALDLCRGRVLDVGAGAGSHALVLQERGLNVTAVDVDAQAVEVMRRRGVHRALRGDFLRDPDAQLGGPFDTLLLLMNGIGLAGDLDGLDLFFHRAAEHLAPGGQLLFDSTDLRLGPHPREMARMAARVRAGRYRGATLQRLLYHGVEAPPLAWLYVDEEMLRAHAERAGWASQVIFTGPDGTYLARLTRLWTSS